MTISDSEIHARRKIAVQWLEWACMGSEIPETHERYIAVTEGRDSGPMRRRYSSCGDLAHWMLYRVGVRMSWLNRDELNKWRVGRNISSLVYRAPSKFHQPGTPYDGGDIAITWSRSDTSDAHAICCIDRIGDTLLTAEYQTILTNGAPGGMLREHTIRRAGDYEMIGRRKLQSWVPLDAVLRDADMCGKLVDPEDVPGG